jgi:transposase
MAMGKRARERQGALWVATTDLPLSGGHPFYEALNGVLGKGGFDDFVEEQCSKFYAVQVGRPGLAPGVYFRMLLVGYFEGIDSERGIAWRCSDSLALRSFLGLALSQSPPDHSTVSRTRRLIDVETHAEVFAFVLGQLADHDLVVLNETPTELH